MIDITINSGIIEITISILSPHFFLPGMDLCLVVQARIWEII